MTRTHVNAEFKARCADLKDAARLARSAGGRPAGRERQIDTYYNVPRGRLKIRETGRHAELVWYFRPDTLRSRRSDVIMLTLTAPSATKAILARELGEKVVVSKVRRIYVKQNVRVHLDDVRGLGTFVEIESVGRAAEFPRLVKKAEEMARELGLRQGNLVRGSYSDLILASRKRPAGHRDRALV